MMISTLTTAMTVDRDTTRPSPTHSLMSNFVLALPMLRNSLLTVAKTPIASNTVHNTTDAVTRTTPSATDSRNDSLSTDHGSTLATVSRTLRGALTGIPPVGGTGLPASAYVEAGRPMPLAPAVVVPGRPPGEVTAVGADAERAAPPSPPGADGRPDTLGPDPARYVCSDELTLTSALPQRPDRTPSHALLAPCARSHGDPSGALSPPGRSAS